MLCCGVPQFPKRNPNMSRKPIDHRTKSKDEEEDEVNMLLRATEDDLLLGLSLNSHVARGSSHAPSSYLDPELHNRFQSLKSNSKTPAKKTSEEKKPESRIVETDVDDLFVRFAKLKGSDVREQDCSSGGSEGLDLGKKIRSDDDEDEVEKVMRWAIDAARLDPFPDTDEDDCIDSDTSDDEEEEVDKKGKGSKKKKF